MKEFWRRLTSVKRLTWEIVFVSFIINFLGLASSVYSIQVLNRYLALGIDSTLITLTIGVVLALILELITRSSRLKIVQWICLRADKKLSDITYKLISSSRYSAIESLPIENRKEALNGLNTIQMTYGAQNLISIVDGPFSLLFLYIIFMLNPNIAFAITILMLLIILLSLIIYSNSDEPSKQLTNSTLSWSSEQSIISSNTELIRTFNVENILRDKWNRSLVDVLKLRKIVVYIQSLGTSLTYSATAIQTILIYSIGAIEVMKGNLDVGSLIGISILASRSMGNITKILQLVEPIKRGERALESISLLSKLSRTDNKKMMLSNWNGDLSFEDFAFAYNGQAIPIIESFNLDIKKGQIICISGFNGAGKTTFAKLLCGLMDPTRGRIKIDGMDLRQADPTWWREKIMYLPQEATFFNGTIHENITLGNEKFDDEFLIKTCFDVGLNEFLDNTKEGLYTTITNNGQSLPLGIKRRIALVRALLNNAPLVIFDEPTESLDVKGVKSIASILSKLVKEGKTIFIMTNEDFIIKAADLIVDLNKKPKAEIINNSKMITPRNKKC
ncbi:ATP-binding cassette domain-containing protein [Arcobacter peruensis]|uniref:ATP-binding cassette domain-containing protein n=1 Tax=Arcobacter peruensis TaxID=2320140 RepID=UPI000F0883ED|nr:ATP-binding cassette domain-containing protein [Arcobacter peruensis]